MKIEYIALTVTVLVSKKISATSKAVNTALFGIFGTKRNKQWHCEKRGIGFLDCNISKNFFFKQFNNIIAFRIIYII